MNYCQSKSKFLVMEVFEKLCWIQSDHKLREKMLRNHQDASVRTSWKRRSRSADWKPHILTSNNLQIFFIRKYVFVKVDYILNPP